ncbi:hypothetical protein B0T26DRAFT_367719 [Lasiosphaeria miniovina]|uniref:Transmembrane protein n=1 Tax=Lasiosphaeria miniovina TaxID=1954250 RepID=A0AA40DVW0_9PEZI|nr:uncharacterized protein B0T26DRAFT_367719 [Lasiosphaeria miniovina]KAK0713643.1 hypothetical protein B0T26DRAFT_367719 [Lasiosphaeria miniovina]
MNEPNPVQTYRSPHPPHVTPNHKLPPPTCVKTWSVARAVAAAVAAAADGQCSIAAFYSLYFNLAAFSSFLFLFITTKRSCFHFFPSCGLGFAYTEEPRFSFLMNATQPKGRTCKTFAQHSMHSLSQPPLLALFSSFAGAHCIALLWHVWGFVEGGDGIV